MNSIRSILVLIILCSAVPASAQLGGAGSGAKRLYCWDQGGQRICSDVLPQEAIGTARDEFSSRSGRHLQSVDRALTPEERAELALQEAEHRARAEAQARRQRTEANMLATYATEDDLRHIFAKSVSMIQGNIKTAQYNRDQLRESVLVLLRRAVRTELQGNPVPDELKGEIQTRHAELLMQLNILIRLEQQQSDLDNEMQRTLQRYRELKSQTAQVMR